jgi:aminomethyltransferase
MPVQYSGIADEHRAVRNDAGVFDVSHMGELRVAGEGSREYLQARLSNDLDRIAGGEAQYTLLTNPSGGIIDDLIAYRRADDVSDEWAYLAVQGPNALERLGVEIEPFTFREEVDVLGVRCLVAGTGYTGERGCELGCSPADAVSLWDAILDRGVVPCGLGARDTLRLEVCYPLHGNDISAERTPIEAGLGWACSLDKEFTGAEVLRRQKSEGPEQKLVAFVMADPGIPRAGMQIAEGGEVTSGTLSPMLEVGIGLGYVPSALAQPGTEITIDLRGRPRRAHIVQKPFYKREEP